MNVFTEVKGDEAVVEKFGAMPEKARVNLRAEVYRQTLSVEALAKAKVSGPVLKVRSGALRRSIHSVVTSGDNEIVGKVASSGDIKYPPIHEYGGKTRAHIIEAIRGNALKFTVNGVTMFRKRVNHPGSVMPERSFLRSSLRELRGKIAEGLQSAVNRSLT